MNTFANLRSRIARSENERGAVLVLTALVMLLLLFIAAFSTDLGAWYRQSEEQQRAADVGSLNGVAAYNRVLQDTFDSAGPNGVDTVQELQAFDVANGTTFSEDAEEEGLLEAARQIRQLLETSGLTFPAGDAAFSSPMFSTVIYGPNGFVQNPDSVSSITLTADDGTIIFVRRVLTKTGEDLNGNAIYTRAIQVEIQRVGEQYFSNILRDAPTITRAAEAVTSNCGAACENNIQLNPPFFGFDAPGNGDGYTPLLLDTDGHLATGDDAVDEIWAVNHHATGVPISRGLNGGSIICFDAETQDACDGNVTQYDLPYATPTEITEHIHTDSTSLQFGYIYYPAVDLNLNASSTITNLSKNPRASEGRPGDATDTNDNRAGIACFDTINRQPCPTPFRSFWGMDTNVDFPGWINVDNVIFVEDPNNSSNDRLYVFAQHGEVACVQLNMADCGTGGPQSLGVNAADFPALNSQPMTSSIRQDAKYGDRAIWTQARGKDLNFVCVDLSNTSGTVGNNCGTFHWPSGSEASRTITFERYDQAQALVGVCALNLNSQKNQCFDFNGNKDGSINGLVGTAFGGDLTNAWTGQAFTWEERRTFFGTASGNKVLCWNWELGGNENGAPCSELSHIVTDDNFARNDLGLPPEAQRENKGEGVQPYAFAQIDDNCIIALGDEAIFFSFDPVGFTPCTESTVTTAISPCACADETAGVRWGAVEFPPNLISQIDYLEVSISTNENSPALPGFDSLVIFDAANGVTDTLLDLSPLDNVTATTSERDLDPSSPTDRPVFFLTVRVDTKIVNGQPVFTQPQDIDLQILVAPTLSE